MFSNRPEMDSPEYKSWRNAIFVRDKFLCQMCTQPNKKIHAHHIIPWAKNEQLRYISSNGIVLCEDCHRTVTGKEELYEEQFKNIIGQKKIQKQKDLGVKPKGKFAHIWFKYRPKNPHMRF